MRSARAMNARCGTNFAPAKVAGPVRRYESISAPSRCSRTWFSSEDSATVGDTEVRKQDTASYLPDARLEGFPSLLDKDIVKMAIPSLASIIVDPLMGMVDVAIVGQLGGGGEVLAGVGLGSIATGSFNWIFSFLSILTIPKIAAAMAKNDKANACMHTSQAMWVAIIAGLSTMTLIATSAPAILSVVGGDPAMLGHACQYMYARCIGNPFVLLNFVFIGCCRGLKDPKTPLYAVMLANLSNLLMDILFVYGFNMGAAGAALATSISQMLSCSILCTAMIKRGFIKWDDLKEGPKWSILRPFLLDGAAVSLRTMSMLAMVMVSSSVLARVNTASQAAHEIVRQTWIFLFQFVECINISNQSLVSAALGAEENDYALEVVKRHLVYSVGLLVVMGGILLTFHQQILGLFTPDSSVIATAWTALPLVVLAFPLDAIGAITDGTLTAAGQATWVAQMTTIISLGSTAAMLLTASVVNMDLLRVWLFLKGYTALRVPFVVHRAFYSLKGPFGKMRNRRVGGIPEADMGRGLVTQPAVDSL